MVFLVAMFAGLTVAYLYSMNDEVPDTDPDLAEWIVEVEGEDQ